MKQNMDLTSGNIYKLFFKFLLSSILGTLAVSFYILFDTIFIGQALGGAGLAALNICLPIYTLLSAIGLLIGMGGGTSFSIALGNNEPEKAHKIFTFSIGIGLIIALACSLFGLIFLDEIAYLLGATPEILTFATDYMSYLLLFAPSFILVNILTVFMRNNNAPHIAMFTTIISGVINIILDAIFLFPLNMGMKGAILATCIASVTSFVILTLCILRRPGNLKLSKNSFELKLGKDILIIGLPTFIIETCSGLVIFLFNIVLLSKSGTIGVSAYGIIANIALMAMAVFNGIGQGIQPLISVNYAAKESARTVRIKKLGLQVALLAGILFYTVGYFMRYEVAGLFISNDPSLLQVAADAIPYYFIAFLITGFNLVQGYYFQAIARPKASVLLSLSRGLLFIVIGLMLLPNLLGLVGIWLVVPFAEFSTLILLGCFLYFEKRKHYKISA